MKIDAHHHLWKYDPVEYSWIDDEMKIIRRDFLVADIEKTATEAGIEGVVTVQARQSLAETEWLLSLSEKSRTMKAVIGWVPLISQDIEKHLEKFSLNPKFKAVRHVLQGESDESYMLRNDFNRGIKSLKKYNLAYDILVFERHLPQTIKFVDMHPSQSFVLDHLAKPQIRKGILEPWRKNIKELAKRQNVSCKISGMVTEADYKNWTPSQLKPYFETVLESFGPSRLMFGSDWPVCLVACEYRKWLKTVSDFTADLSQDEKDSVFGRSAEKFYSL